MLWLLLLSLLSSIGISSQTGETSCTTAESSTLNFNFLGGHEYYGYYQFSHSSYDESSHLIDPNCPDPGRDDYWYLWRAPPAESAPDKVEINTCGMGYRNLRLQVYELNDTSQIPDCEDLIGSLPYSCQPQSCSCSSLFLNKPGLPNPCLKSRLQFAVTGGKYYLVRIGFVFSYVLTGPGQFSISPYFRDSCDGLNDTMFLNDLTGVIPFNLVNRHRQEEAGQDNELCAQDIAGKSPISSAIYDDVWFLLETDSPSSIIVLSTCSDTYDWLDTKIAAYPYNGFGCPEPGTALQCNDDSPCVTEEFSRQSFIFLTGSSLYLIQIGSFSPQQSLQFYYPSSYGELSLEVYTTNDLLGTDIAISLSTPARVVSYSSLTYKVTIMNEKPGVPRPGEIAENVEVVLKVKDLSNDNPTFTEIEFVSAESSGECVVPDVNFPGNVLCRLDELLIGASYDFDITFIIYAGSRHGTRVSGEVTVSCDSADIDASDNSDIITTDVLSLPTEINYDIRAELTADKISFGIGEHATYFLTLTSYGVLGGLGLELVIKFDIEQEFLLGYLTINRRGTEESKTICRYEEEEHQVVCALGYLPFFDPEQISFQIQALYDENSDGIAYTRVFLRNLEWGVRELEDIGGHILPVQFGDMEIESASGNVKTIKGSAQTLVSEEVPDKTIFTLSNALKNNGPGSLTKVKWEGIVEGSSGGEPAQILTFFSFPVITFKGPDSVYARKDFSCFLEDVVSNNFTINIVCEPFNFHAYSELEIILTFEIFSTTLDFFSYSFEVTSEGIQDINEENNVLSGTFTVEDTSPAYRPLSFLSPFFFLVLVLIPLHF